MSEENNEKEKPYFSIPRAKILSLLKDNPMTIIDIQRKTNLGRSTIYHHLEELKKRKLIIEKKEIKKQGQPVIIMLNNANPLTSKFIQDMEKFLSLVKGVKK